MTKTKEKGKYVAAYDGINIIIFLQSFNTIVCSPESLTTCILTNQLMHCGAIRKQK